MMTRYLIGALLVIITTGTKVRAQHTDSLLNLLVTEMKSKDTFVRARIERINALRNQLSFRNTTHEQDRFDLYNALFLENRKFIYDSAFKYARKLIEVAHEQKDVQRIGYARSQLGYVLVSSGFFKEAFDTLRLVNARTLPDSARVDYYALMARSFFDLGEFDNDHFYKQHYFKLGLLYTDSARLHCVSGGYDDIFLRRIQNIKHEKYPDALEDSRTILNSFPLSWEELAVNHYDISHCYRMTGNEAKALEHLVHSATADIRAATNENLAMYSLARMLYEEGDIDHAHLFIQQAQHDAQFYGARQRQVAISAIQPLIAAAKLNSVDSQRRKLLVFSIALVVLITLVASFVFIIFKQLRRLKVAELTITRANNDLQQTNLSLREANRIKEEYIGYYFNINADYLNKIEAFKKAVEQKLINRKYDELRYTVENINLKREREELSYSFDKVFLNLFPDFINRFNALFPPDEQMVIKEGQILNTEMRIFALIRMGITDPEKIARILGYSVNTIYAYKTRVKSRSTVPNDAFEQYIMEIKTA